jgi:acyl dehydratase
MTADRWFEDIAVGQALPPAETTVSRVTDAEGYPDVVVHGPLQAAILGKLVTDWMGPRGRLVRFVTQNRASAYAEQRLRFTGVVAAVRPVTDASPGGPVGLVDLELREENAEGQLLMPGSATVALPRRA